MTFENPPDAVEIGAALQRVLTSDGFRGAPQLAAFLRHIVEETLAGRAERIKAYTIGVEALGRPAHFDPQRDPIVRVEANRLRQTLAVYYAGAGATDPIVIEIPRGRYVPNFVRRAGSSGTTTTASNRRVRRWPTVTIAAVTLMALAIVWVRMSPREPPATSSLQVPVLTIDPVVPVTEAAEPLATAMGRELLTVFSYVQSISTVPGPVPAPGPDTDAGATGGVRGFRLHGRIETADDGTATVMLRLDYDDMVAWTREWQLSSDGERALADIAREAAGEVGRMFGVIHARVRADVERLAPGYRCLLSAADSLRRFDLTQHIRVRDCLERTIADNPDFALAYGLLAFVYEREYLHDLPARPGEKPALDRSLAAAQHMLTLWPESAVAQVALMENLYLRGDLAGAFAAGDKALALNPIDSVVTGMVGLRLYLGGESERGAALLAKSASRFGSNPAPIGFGLFCVAYMAGDMLAAARHAPGDEEATFPYGLAAQALVAAAKGDRDRARRVLERLKGLHPGWSEPRRMLARFIQSPAILDRLAGDLAAIAEQ